MAGQNLHMLYTGSTEIYKEARMIPPSQLNGDLLSLQPMLHEMSYIDQYIDHILFNSFMAFLKTNSCDKLNGHVM
jgi:hypothetical protein